MKAENQPIDIYTAEWFLPAGQTDARGLMPVTLIVARAIEIATLHANALGIGYSKLSRHRMGWVLARLAVEVKRYPGINETYSMSTWIEGYNRYFSDRCYEMRDEQGEAIAWIRSVWVAIDMETRGMADLSELERDCFPLVENRCPVAKCRLPMIKPGAETKQSTYTFTYTDIDFNRHVNTFRYMELLLNQGSLDFHDTHGLTRFEIAYLHEAYFGETVDVRLSDT
ncbi:MAG: hypothetical protein K2M00_07970, partial [Muribaculaceae bacterium]|nr:hypothetical protein [Muribaculaceae bacterium]